MTWTEPHITDTDICIAVRKNIEPKSTGMDIERTEVKYNTQLTSTGRMQNRMGSLVPKGKVNLIS